MRTLVLLSLVGLLAGFRLAPSHAYHATITELRYNGAQKQLEFSIKVFTDDFEKALSKGQPKAISLSDPGPRPLILASEYVRRHLTVKTAPGRPLPLQVLGMQQEKDAYWLYCKSALPSTLAGIQLRQTMLLDVFPDQQNIVNLEADGKTQSALFRAGHEEELFTW